MNRRPNFVSSGARLPKVAAGVSVLAGLAAAQGLGIPVFSVDYSSPSVSLPNSFTGAPITEGDVLAPQLLVPALGPLATPGILETGGVAAPAGLALGLHPGCVGHPAGSPCGIDVDALSHGMDKPAMPISSTPGTVPINAYAFSVNLRSQGSGFSSPPDVPSEGVCLENTADVYHSFFLPIGPVPPSPGGHSGLMDGNGLANCTGTNLFPGIGLLENPPGTPPGDNLDALDTDVPDAVFPRTTCTYFSLDGLIFDPITLIAGSGSAQAHGFRPGDVLMTPPGGSPAVYAPAFQLGLDLPPLLLGSDDLDALILWENGIAGYQRSTTLYDWTTGASDMLFFSVRRGSAIIGQLDSIFGIPIEPGDILTPTGPLGSLPGIWIAAEALGLQTFRGITPLSIGDDVDALDSLEQREQGVGFCPGDGTGTTCPCGNSGSTGRGCGNSVNGFGARLWSNGFASISNDTLVFHASGMPNTAANRLFQGTTQSSAGVVFGDGLRCVFGSILRFPVRNALCGNRSYGFGVAGDPSLSTFFGITSPVTRYYQVQYRDAAPTFCTPLLFNFTNGYTVTWTL